MEKKLNAFFVFALTFCALFFSLVAACMLLGAYNSRFGGFKAAETEEKEINVISESVILGETEDLGTEYIDKIIFLGESTTYGLQSYGVLSDGIATNQVWTGATVKNGEVVSSGTLSLSPSISQTKIFFPDTKSALTVSEALKIKKPEIMIITLGLNNGASYYDEQEFKSCYRSLLDSVKSADVETDVILQSIFPVAKSCKIKAYTPEKIKKCNEWIYDLAKEYDLKYLNTAEALCDEDGYLFDSYENGGDGIHLNRDGLIAVLEYIRKHGAVK